eukprot:CAMPEP_0172558486 /NCGR_PEP_ID=MMETSP1067-20121228/79332_1 /TAXON_ID=265564 ORGANISM="Thalassiosira punctigera, Strain Tpunct2005C2" /NCGR_SAMPLE_ID=MMETSP1067 /ASSEMBLY_ACC=CAM_ASM_000444 /LENGTH=46 /DNA_ID= /DNA_START= /DNA_END= /DNA_ORIENTATION=
MTVKAESKGLNNAPPVVAAEEGPSFFEQITVGIGSICSNNGSPSPT